MLRKTLLSLAVISSGLGMMSITGCSTVALTATDPRSISTVTTDQYIKRDLAYKYTGDEFKNDHPEVNAYNYEVLLTGAASSYAQRHKIVKIASEEKDVIKVYDYINVTSKYDSTFTDDTFITSKVKTQLFSAGDVNSNDVQVVTSNGTVYILGLIKKSQLKNMLKVAKSVDGVKDVVPLVHYKSSDSKLNLPIGN